MDGFIDRWIFLKFIFLQTVIIIVWKLICVFFFIIFLNFIKLKDILQASAAAHKPHIKTCLSATRKNLKRWIVCFGTCSSIQLNFKVMIWRFHWGLHAAYAQLPSPDIFSLVQQILRAHPINYKIRYVPKILQITIK